MSDSPKGGREEPTVYDWVGDLVLVNYTRGPYWEEVKDPYDIARGALEGREGVFLLQEVSSLGVLVRRPVPEKQNWAQPVFMPWVSVHAVRQLTAEQEPAEPGQQG